MIQKMMGLMKKMERRHGWLAEQARKTHELQISCCNNVGIDTSEHQWEDWDSDEWMGSDSEEDDVEEEEEAEE